MNVEQERADFEAWLRIKPCGAAHDFAWEAWRARAAMQSQPLTVDALAQEIRRVNGNNALGAGALAEALVPFLESALQSQEREDAVPYRIVVDAALKLLGAEQYERFMGELDHARRGEGADDA